MRMKEGNEGTESKGNEGLVEGRRIRGGRESEGGEWGKRGELWKRSV